MDRRTFLVRSAVVASLGVLGTGGVRLARDAATVVPEGTKSKVVRGSFTSTAMGRDVQWRYCLPSVPARATIFSLHGRGGNAAETFDSLGLHEVVARLGLPLAVVSVDGGDHSYWHGRRDGTNALTMLTNELIPRAEQVTKTTPRLLFGWSMGGYGALLAAATNPGTFAGVAAVSPALWTNAGASAAGAFDDADDFRAHDVFRQRSALRTQAVHLACGNEDPFFAATKTFISQLPAADRAFGPGGHTVEFWRAAAPAALTFLARAATPP